MKNYRIFQIMSLILMGSVLNACFGDLDTEPLDNESITSASIFDMMRQLISGSASPNSMVA